MLILCLAPQEHQTKYDIFGKPPNESNGNLAIASTAKYWKSVRAFSDHVKLHSRFLSAPDRPETGSTGDEPGSGKKILGPRGPEPWLGLWVAQLPLFAVAQISDPVLTLQS